MRSVLVFSTLFFASTTIWLFVELRSTWDSFNSVVVDLYGSSIVRSQSIANHVSGGDLDAALEALKKQQLSAEYGLSQVRAAIDSSSCRWNDQSEVVERASQFLAESAVADTY
jgi:hypothetical protein